MDSNAERLRFAGGILEELHELLNHSTNNAEFIMLTPRNDGLHYGDNTMKRCRTTMASNVSDIATAFGPTRLWYFNFHGRTSDSKE